MPKFAGRAIGLLCLFVVMASAQTSAPPLSLKVAALLNSASEPVRIVCFGDSVTGVYYHTGGRRAYTEMLGIALKRLYPNADIQTINAGISGNTTVDALNRIDADVLAHKPQLVTVMFGLNDMTRVPLEDYKANLAAIIKKCRDASAEVMLCTPNSVAETPARPIAKLIEYVAAMKQVAETEQVPLVDCYAGYDAIHAEDPFKWQMLMSDEIHPNMMGHKRFAEMLVKTITGQSISLEQEGPPEPLLPKTQTLLKENKPLRIYAMPPYDAYVLPALRTVAPDIQAEVTPWPVQGSSLADIETSAKQVREIKPDLVIAAVPAEATADSKESYLRAYKWILNYALSFGYQEWDCLAVTPTVTNPGLPPDALENASLARSVIWAQDIGMVERNAGDARSAEEVFTEWFKAQITGNAAPCIEVGNRAQLFIDNRFVASSENMSFQMNTPKKMGPVLWPDKPWESGEIGFCVSVVQYEGEYKMWYLARDKANKFNQCFARSQDGQTWEKPELGLIDYQGSKNNNIVLTGAVETTVFLDPVATPDKRFKALSAMNWPDAQNAGLYVWCSPDGLHWDQAPVRVFPLLPDTANQAFYDTRLKKYVANIRVWDPLRKVGRVEMDDILAPWPYTPLEKPFYIWGPNSVPVPSREVPVVFSYDEKDPPVSDHYNAACIQYPWADDAYFMFPSPYRHFPEPPVGKWGNDGLVDIQMAVSRDGVKWQRPSRAPYVEMGIEGASDSMQMYMGIGVVRNDNVIYQYYGGYISTHGQPNVENGGSIQRLEQRLDGFMSIDASWEGGSLTTPKIIFSGKRLVLNVNGSAMGTGKVALLDANGTPIPGYSLDECDEFGANSLAREITWKGNGDVSAWAGKPIRLSFAMRAMKLYAFQFAE